MVFDATITTEDEVDVMSGENVNVTGATADRKSDLVKQAEGFLSALLRDDVTAGYAGYGTNLKLILNEYGARYAAMSLIMFNTSAFSDGIEAENMVTVHWARLLKIEETLTNEDTINFLKGT